MWGWRQIHAVHLDLTFAAQNRHTEKTAKIIGSCERQRGKAEVVENGLKK